MCERALLDHAAPDEGPDQEPMVHCQYIPGAVVLFTGYFVTRQMSSSGGAGE